MFTPEGRVLLAYLIKNGANLPEIVQAITEDAHKMIDEHEDDKKRVESETKLIDEAITTLKSNPPVEDPNPLIAKLTAFKKSFESTITNQDKLFSTWFAFLNKELQPMIQARASAASVNRVAMNFMDKKIKQSCDKTGVCKLGESEKCPHCGAPMGDGRCPNCG